MQPLTRFETRHFLFGHGEAKIISAVFNSFMHHNAGRIVFLDTVCELQEEVVCWLEAKYLFLNDTSS